MAADTTHPSVTNLELPAATLGVPGSPFFLAHKNAARTNGTSVEAWTNSTDIMRIQTGGPHYRYLNLYLCLFEDSAQTLSTQPVVQVYGSTPNHKTSPSLDALIQNLVDTDIDALPADEAASACKLFPLIPAGYTNASTSTAVTFPSVTANALYSGSTKDIHMFPPISFFLEGATAIYTTVTTAGDTMTGDNKLFILGRFTG